MPVERVFAISALTREGCEPLCLAANEYLESIRPSESDAVDVRFERAADTTPDHAASGDDDARESAHG
jgi:hypothetical protein